MERLTLEQLKQLTGVDAAIVTSEGGGETMINVLNGTLDIAMGELQEMRSQIEGGEIKVLAVASDERLENYPDMPTLQEAGVDLVVRKFRGLAGPEGLPDDIVAIWEQAIPRLLEHPEYREVYSGLNLIPAFIPHEEYVEFIDDFAEDNRSMLRELGVLQN
jgi:tripartite-type tricarboxylate transporter receptor subunit TctC